MIWTSAKWQRIRMSEFDLVLFHNLRKLYSWQDDGSGFISKEIAA
jgi:hypothetical protein